MGAVRRGGGQVAKSPGKAETRKTGFNGTRVPERSADLRRLDQIKDRPVGAGLGRREGAPVGGFS